MFCQNCGTQVHPGQSYCTGCAQALTGYGLAQQSNLQGRVQRNLDPLGIFWIVYSSLGLIGGFAILIVAQVIFGPNSRLHEGAPGFLHPLLLGVALFMLIKAALGIAAGVGLRQHSPWARDLAIVLGFIELIHLPFGTALGIYTIWTLLSAGAEMEYQSLPQVA